MAAAASSSSSGSSCWKYDVFLNFRGEDTRRSFVSHLYKALDQKTINTFIDAEDVSKGDRLSELLTTIQESRLSIVVFSENYASSTWCLKELVQILECMDTKKQMVVPIFYQVDPSHVRTLKRSFAEAFAQHKHDSNTDMEEVQSWKSALTRATNLSGWDSRNYGDDAKLIEEIVNDIFNKLIHISSSKAHGFVGMDSHMHEMDLLLHPAPGVDDVCIVGIWGMGGIGKTTIARSVYDEIACQFEACCFLENVKEGFSKNGAVLMQEELLSRILKQEVRGLGTLDKGFNMIMERLGKKRVFIVLDDVDTLTQIEALLGKQHSFRGGSRIILTTRDKHLLSGVVNAIYSPKGLRDSGAHELFSQYAFRTNQPTDPYHYLSRLVVEYAQGLPLALKVLGAFLDNKSVHEWEVVLEKIKKFPPRDILDVLKISLDGLDESEKNMFLDIACFFKGMKKDTVTKILDSFGFFPQIGLRVLVDRALLTITEWDKLEMHDLLQEMGRDVVRQESTEPGKRSRLWSHEDVDRVYSGTEAVGGIFLDLSNSNEVYLNSDAFVGMTKLRMLIISYDYFYIGRHSEYLARWYPLDRSECGDPWDHSECWDPSETWDRLNPSGCKQHVTGDFKFLSHELRFLHWPGCPLKSLPSNFSPKNVVELDMRGSDIEQLWEGIKRTEESFKQYSFEISSNPQY